MARFPHEFTMKKYHLIETDLNEDANEDQQKKLNRLSRAVCMEIEYMVEEAPEEPILEATTKPPLEDPAPPLEVPAKEKPTTSQAGESPFNIFSF